MLIFNEHNETLILDSIYTPLTSDYLYVLDLNLMDFTLAPLTILEEIVAPTVEVQVLGFKFRLPANWNMLVVDYETMILDTVEIAELAGKEFSTLLYGPNTGRYDTAVVYVTDYSPNEKNVGPSLPKHQMLCHPVTPELWVNVAPSDTYNKHLKGKVVGDLM